VPPRHTPTFWAGEMRGLLKPGWYYYRDHKDAPVEVVLVRSAKEWGPTPAVRRLSGPTQSWTPVSCFQGRFLGPVPPPPGLKWEDVFDTGEG